MTDTPDEPTPNATPELAAIERRLSRIEAMLETFFDALATTGTPNAADATGDPGSGLGLPIPRPQEREALAALRRTLDGRLSWEKLTPAQVIAMVDAADAAALRDDDDEFDSLRAQAEALARRLLLERDAETLRQRGARAGCWDADGRLIGTGATAAEAERDAMARYGAAGVLGRISAELPERGAEAWQLMHVIVEKLDALPDAEADAAAKRLEEALLAADAPRAQAERLASTLLLRRDGEALRWFKRKAACWDDAGRLVGTGETRGDALRDAVEHEGAEQDGVAWLTAEVPSESEEVMRIDPALRRLAERDEATVIEALELSEAIYKRLDAMPDLAELTPAAIRVMVEEAMADLRGKGGDE